VATPQFPSSDQISIIVAGIYGATLLALKGSQKIVDEWNKLLEKVSRGRAKRNLIRSGQNSDDLRPPALAQRDPRYSHRRGKANPKTEFRTERQRPRAPTSAESSARVASRGKKVP
jgi:hypothetical protein